MRGLFGNPDLVDSLRLNSTDDSGIECLRKIYDLYASAQESQTIRALGIALDSSLAPEREENWISPQLAGSLDPIADAVR
ncbi:MAG: hypothetical protein VKK43_00525, partial [Synechococcaceae cyanobacterium]|nr:hypothetical protein [Synechococcaceae cyanobacterium]